MPRIQTNRTYVRLTTTALSHRIPCVYEPENHSDLELRQRRARVRRILAVIILLALVTALLVPTIVRVVTRPPETVITQDAFPA